MIEKTEYLAFRVGEEEYGVDILDVQEIRQYEAPTRIANAPAYMLGVVNLRGAIVPITDLGQVLRQRNTPITDQTVTVFCTLGKTLQGLVVDAVNDVIDLSEDQKKPAPDFADTVQQTRPIVNQIASLGDKRHVLLTSVDALLEARRAPVLVL